MVDPTGLIGALAKILKEKGLDDSASPEQLAEALKEVIQITLGQSREYSPSAIMEAYIMLLEREPKVTWKGRSPFLSFLVGPKEEITKSLN